MTLQIGVGDVFTYKKDHWMIVDVKEDKYVCKNKDNGAVVEFDKSVVKKLVE